MAAEKGREKGFGTRCVHAGEGRNPYGAHATPIYQTSSFSFDSSEEAEALFSGKQSGYVYVRAPPGTPTHFAFTEKLVSLEGGEAGISFSSGMAAEAAVILSNLKQGDHLLSTDAIYGGTFGLFSSVLPRYGIQVSYADTSDLEAVRSGLRENSKMVFLETPANPTMSISDIGEISSMAREAGAITVVDNTFASPCFQRPIELGADAVVESCTKYIGGHSDLLGGAVVGRSSLIRGVRRMAVSFGSTMGTFEAWLALRGLKTLHLRMARHASNALAMARFLEGRPEVRYVRYPGLSSHPQHRLASRQMSGYGGMLSFELRGGREAAQRLMNAVELSTLAVSLGSVDTLIEHPASMTHANIPPEVRERTGISPGLVRISAGIEDPEDLIQDLEQGLERI